MKPGLYRDLSIADYVALDAASSSALHTLATESPAHLQAERRNPRQSNAMDEGTIFHCLVLEPDSFLSRYTLVGRCDATYKSGKRKGQQCAHHAKALFGGVAYCGKHGEGLEADPVNVVAQPDYHRLVSARDAVYANPDAKKILDRATVELTAIWVDDETGMLCKARPDITNEVLDCTADLKSTRDASYKNFGWDAYNYGYYRQGEFHQIGIRQYGDELLLLNPAHKFIAAETQPPFVNRVYNVPEYIREVARAEIRQLMRRYARCVKRNEWLIQGAKYPQGETDLWVPPSALIDIDERLAVEAEYAV